MLQNAAALRKSAAWPPNISGEHVSCMRLPREMHLCRSCSHVPRLPTFLNCCKTFAFCSLLGRCRILCACHAKRHLNVQKWSEHVVRFCVFSMLTWKCASRHNGVHFFDISTSKSGKNMVCVLYILTSERASHHSCVQFFDMSTSKSGPSIGNVLRAATACTFSTSQLLDVPRSWGVLRILTSKCASRNNGVQCSISYLTTWLRARRFSEPTFRPSWATNHWKNIVFRDFATFRAPLPFAHLHLLSSHSFSSLIFSLLLFSSLTLPTSAFPSVHIVGSLTSKLPSMNAFRCFVLHVVHRALQHHLIAMTNIHAGVPLKQSFTMFWCGLMFTLHCFVIFLVFILVPTFKLFWRWLQVFNRGHFFPALEFAHAEVYWHASEVSHSLETLSGSAWNPSRHTMACGILVASSKQEHLRKHVKNKYINPNTIQWIQVDFRHGQIFWKDQMHFFSLQGTTRRLDRGKEVPIEAPDLSRNFH